MKNHPFKYSISVVSHGQEDDVRRLLDSMVFHESLKQVQILLTENLPGHPIPDFDFVREASIQPIQNSVPRGFAANHNHAFALATGKFYCVINPDVVFTEPVLEHLCGHLEGGAADIVAPLVVDQNGQIQDSFRDIPTPFELMRRQLGRSRLHVPKMDRSKPIYPQWIAAIMLLVPSGTYKALGGFSESYELYFEDVEFCSRARLTGRRLLVDPSTMIVHDPHRASRRKLKYFLIHARSALRFYSSSTYWRTRRLPRPGSDPLG